jgi:hypothetical protein
MKALFNLKEKYREFLLGDLVLRWDARREEAAKHGKFDHLWYDHSGSWLQKERTPFFWKTLTEKSKVPLSTGDI